jgi:thiol:disulfide interchange protein DsbC
MNLKTLAAAAALVAAGAVMAGSDAGNKITQLLSTRLGGVEVARPKPTPIPGIYQTTFGGKVAYLTEDGRYAFVGDLIDLQAQVNLSEQARRGLVKKAIAEVPLRDMAIYPARGEKKAVLNVFTDTSCPYCKKLHEEVPDLQKAGIEVRYLPYPRGSSRGPGYQSLKQVWCADDKARAMNIAKGLESGSLPSADCAGASMVDKGYELGNRVGVEGTPALFTESGKKISGYVPSERLIPMLLGQPGS